MPKHILRVVDILIWTRQNAVYDTRFEIEQDGAGDIPRVVGLVEEDIFAVVDLSGEGLEIAITVDAVFEAELLPKLRADCTDMPSEYELVDLRLDLRHTAVAALARLERDDFSRHKSVALMRSQSYGAYLGIVTRARGHATRCLRQVRSNLAADAKRGTDVFGGAHAPFSCHDLIRH